MAAKYQKTKKFYEKKHSKTIKIFKKTPRNHQYVWQQYRKIFIENERSEEEKTENVNIHATYIIIFLKKKPDKSREYACEKYQNLSE